MIADPHNDIECLGAITDEARRLVAHGDPAAVEIAERYASTEELAEAIRQKPQRDDEGLAGDGPKVAACRPAQRLRLDAADPNCVERSFEYLVGAEQIDPDAVRRLATIETSNGLHTFPTEDGEPVILDPVYTRNALRQGLAEIEARRLRLQRLIGTDESKGVRGDLARARASQARGHTTWVDGRPIDQAIASYERALATYQERLEELPRNATDDRQVVAMTPREAVDYVAELAYLPAARFASAPRRVQRGHRALRGVLVGRPLCIADVRDVALLLALADYEARARGPGDQRIVRTCAHAVDRLDRLAADRWLSERSPRNAPQLRIGRYRVQPNVPLLAALGRVGGRLGTKVGVEALRVKLASMGVTPPVLNSIEQELNREGLSLGALAAPPPMPGSLVALTPEAIAGKWLAGKF